MITKLYIIQFKNNIIHNKCVLWRILYIGTSERNDVIPSEREIILRIYYYIIRTKISKSTDSPDTWKKPFRVLITSNVVFTDESANFNLWSTMWYLGCLEMWCDVHFEDHGPYIWTDRRIPKRFIPTLSRHGVLQ